MLNLRKKIVNNTPNISTLLDFARSVAIAERSAIEQITHYIDDSFIEIASIIYNSSSRLIITGIGKSAIIAQKIVATLNSTGTPSVFLHAADAIHGDLGIVQSTDIVMCISKSGNSPEIQVLVPLIKRMGNVVIAMVGNIGSHLDRAADYTINTTVDCEACPNNLAPTSSTTAQLVMGDALAMTLLKMRGFTAEDFSKFHPGGALGKKLYTRVEDIITDSRPMVYQDDTLQRVIIEISSGRLGATAVVDSQDIVVGIITDGDLRRMLEKQRDFQNLTARDIMTCSPKSVQADTLAIEAYNTMESNKITNLVVLNDHRYVGILHLHDIHRGGVV